jgi:phosphate uptake regulator
MALGELERIGDYAGMISDRIKSMPDLESWVQSKITKAKDYLTSVHDYLDGIDGDTQDDI